MKERPIIFSAPMVRAILAGTKTQTRRVVKLDATPEPRYSRDVVLRYRCPFGQPGDRLWVREAWAAHWMYDDVPPIQAHSDRADLRVGDNRWFAADGENGVSQLGKPSGLRGRWRPSIHMPRWASRITLEITRVRVERLQYISESDAQAEGCSLECMTPTGDDSGSAIYGPGGYIAFWESINGPGSWVENPWVWVVEFKRVEGEVA